MKRRHFFKRFAAIGLALALAPEIAFHGPVKLTIQKDLSLLPFEDQLQEILCQMLIAAKQNLYRIVYDEKPNKFPYYS